MGGPSRFHARAWLIVVAFLVAIATAIVLAARSEPALRWAAERATVWSGGRLALEGVSGSVLGPLRVSRLRFLVDGVEYQAQGLEADWHPASAFLGPLRITRLAAEGLTVRVQSSGPVQLPDNLGLPLDLRLAGVAVKRVLVATPEGETAIDGVAGSASLGPTGYAVTLASAQFAWGRLAGEAKLAAARPFALSGRLQVAPAALEGRSVPVAISGALEAIEAGASLELPWGNADASVVVAPFAQHWLHRLHAEVKGANPARARPGLPEANIAAVLDASAANGTLSGTLEMVNQQPGRLDQHLLPIEKVTARLAGTPDAPRLEALTIALPGGATLAGSGVPGPQGIDLRLHTRGVPLNVLHGALKPLSLAGEIILEAAPEEQSLVAELASGAYRLTLDAVHRGSVVTVRSAALRARGSELLFAGELSGEGAFSGQGTLKQFDPALWGGFPAARLNAQLEFSGRFSPGTEASVRYRVADSSFRKAPLAGEGTLDWSESGVIRADGHLALGDNRATFSGTFGRPGERLAWALDAPALGVLGKEFAGRLNGSGWLSGTPRQPALEFELRGTEIRLPGLVAGSLQATGKLDAAADGELAARVSARDLKSDELALAGVDAEAAGTVARHTLSVDARGAVLDLRARLEGGLLVEARRWNGSLLTLEASKPYALRLAAPAQIELAPDDVKIGGAELSFAGGRILLDEFRRSPRVLRHRGRVESVPLAAFLPRAEGARWHSTIIVSGAWDLEAGEGLRGSLRIVRERGDIVLTGARTVPLGLSELSLEARAQDSGFEALLSARGNVVGALRGRLEAQAERTETGWRIASDAPLRGEFKASVPSLAWLGPLADPLLATAGSIELDASVSGSARTPSVQGILLGKSLEAHVDTAGLHLTDGVLDAAFTGDRLEVRELKFRGGRGELTARGGATFSEDERRGALEFSANKLAIVELPSQILETSGAGRVELEGRRVAISGTLRADRGVIELRELERPRLSDDVVVVGREKPAPAAAASALSLALDVDLGDNFVVKGTGLDARLAGSIALRSDNGPTRARGLVRVVEGWYTAYTQRLAIERGSLLFDGPITNPTLDILALRKNQKVEAGVAITGTALAPRVRLVSRPEVPDQEKVSWLVLGQGTGGTEESAFSLPGFTTRKEDYLGVGTQLTSSLHVGIGRSLLGTGTLLRLTYILSEKWSVRASSGDVNGLSILYTISFE